MFENIASIDELRKAYRIAAMKAHPDKGGTDEAMKAVNAAYEKRFEQLKSSHNAQGTQNPINETAASYTAVITELLRISGIDIELCGSWVWVSGDTLPNKDKLKALGLRWSKGKAKWYYTQNTLKTSRGSLSMKRIRAKYGSLQIEKNELKPLLTR